MLDAIRDLFAPPKLNRRAALRALAVAGLAPFVPVPIAELPPVSTWTSFEDALKEYYAEGTVKSIVYETAGTFFQMIGKPDRFGGEDA
jgi:hypothetical protein